MPPAPSPSSLVELPVTRFRNELASWVDKVEGGERLLLTVDRRPVAVMTAFADYDDLQHIAVKQRLASEMVRQLAQI